MNAEPDDLIPVPRIAAAILLGALPPLVLAAILIILGLGIGNNLDASFRMVGTFAMFALGSAVIVGMPVGAIFLRNPQASAIRWIAAGAGSALIAITLVEFWIAGFAFPMMFLTFFGPALLLMNAAVIVYGGLTGLMARTLLPWLARP